MRLGSKFAVAAAAGLLAGVLAWQCTKTPDLPELPLQATMMPDLNSFPTINQSAGKIVAGKADSVASVNLAAAVLVVGIWDALVVLNLAVPVSVYAAAISQKPVVTDSGWVWSFTTLVNSLPYTAELLGAINGGQVNWKMRISGLGLNGNFLWYQGQSDLLATAGSWLFYKINTADSALLINWTRNTASDTTASLTFIAKNQADTTYRSEGVV
jgi:hypothetical protein